MILNNEEGKGNGHLTWTCVCFLLISKVLLLILLNLHIDLWKHKQFDMFSTIMVFIPCQEGQMTSVIASSWRKFSWPSITYQFKGDNYFLGQSSKRISDRLCWVIMPMAEPGLNLVGASQQANNDSCLMLGPE